MVLVMWEAVAIAGVLLSTGCLALLLKYIEKRTIEKAEVEAVHKEVPKTAPKVENPYKVLDWVMVEYRYAFSSFKAVATIEDTRCKKVFEATVDGSWSCVSGKITSNVRDAHTKVSLPGIVDSIGKQILEEYRAQEEAEKFRKRHDRILKEPTGRVLPKRSAYW